MPNKLEISLISKLRREPLENSLQGIIPVASGWGTAPTDLQNTTDGNPATATGVGSTIMGASGSYGMLTYTLPSNGIYLVGGCIGIWSSAGTNTVRWESRPDGINQWFNGAAVLSLTNTTQRVLNASPIVINGNIIAIDFRAGAAGTFNAQIYEVWALKIGSL